MNLINFHDLEKEQQLAFLEKYGCPYDTPRKDSLKVCKTPKEKDFSSASIGFGTKRLRSRTQIRLHLQKDHLSISENACRLCQSPRSSENGSHHNATCLDRLNQLYPPQQNNPSDKVMLD